MAYKEFLEDIKERQLKPVYLCYGQEAYLKDWTMDKLKETYIDPAFETLNLSHLDGREVTAAQIVNSCETLPFMAEKKVVIVENAPFFSGKAVGVNEEEQMQSYIDHPSATTCLVFLVHNDKIDKRKKIVKRIKKEGAIIEYAKLKENDLVKWVVKAFGSEKKKIGKMEARSFIEATGYLEQKSHKTLYDLENEMKKVANYLGERKDVSQEDIDKVLTKSLQNNIFKLVDAIGQRKPSVALSMLNEMLLENEPIQVIMVMIIRQFRLLLMAKLLEEKGYSQGVISKKLGIHPYVAQKVVGQGRNFSSKELKKALEKCLEVDVSAKTGRMDQKLAVEMLIVEFSN